MLNNKILNQFNEALKERNKRGHYAEITFIGVNSATIKEHKIGKILNVTVILFEIITCIKDKDKKIISGDPEKLKKFMIPGFFKRHNINKSKLAACRYSNLIDKKISDKDLKDWEIFTSSKDKLYNKDNITNEKSLKKSIYRSSWLYP